MTTVLPHFRRRPTEDDDTRRLQIVHGAAVDVQQRARAQRLRQVEQVERVDQCARERRAREVEVDHVTVRGENHEDGDDEVERDED